MIPESARIVGEVRGETTELMGYMSEECERVLEGAATMYDCEVEIETGAEAPSATSDQELVDLVADVAGDVSGVENVLERDDLGGSEDATFLMQAVQDNGGNACYVGIGTDHPAGLRHQHLAVLETMAAVCDAEIDGAELGAETVRFDPTPSSTGPDGSPRLEGGQYEVDINTAGSVTLLFDALLPLAPILESPLRVTATAATGSPILTRLVVGQQSITPSTSSIWFTG